MRRLLNFWRLRQNRDDPELIVEFYRTLRGRAIITRIMRVRPEEIR